MLRNSHSHKIQLYSLHEAQPLLWVSAQGGLHWLVIEYFSLETQGTCDSEIRAVLLAEDYTLRVEFFFLSPVPIFFVVVV